LEGFLSSHPLPYTLQKLSKHNVLDDPHITFTHYGVDPHTDKTSIVREGQYQIELYQAIRDYAQDRANFDKGFLSAILMYILPVAYSLLGAFLYAFRSFCVRGRRNFRDRSVDRASRFVMAGIGGIAVSGLSALMPKEVLLSPLVMAFVVGYSIEVLTSRIHEYVRKFEKPTGA
jgi:hypothetical protein